MIGPTKINNAASETRLAPSPTHNVAIPFLKAPRAAVVSSGCRHCFRFKVARPKRCLYEHKPLQLNCCDEPRISPLNARLAPVLVLSILLASACTKAKDETEASKLNNTAVEASNTAVSATASVPVNSRTAPQPAPPSFDAAAQPVSTVKLGAFPYLSLPAGYVASGEKTLDLVRFPIWVGDRFQWIEGKAYLARISAAENKSWSKYEVQRNVEALIAQAGGKKVAEAKIPSVDLERITQDERSALSDGLGDIYNDAAATYLIHQADKDIWVHFSANTAGGNWAIVQAQPFVPSAKLITADAPVK